MKVGIIWRPEPSRMDAFDEVMEFYRGIGFDIALIDSGDPVFNRSASRNAAVEAGCTVISDADCIPDKTPLLEAIRDIDDSAVHLPYTSCETFHPNGTIAGRFTFTCGGCYVTTRDAWFAPGGQDERFAVWAPEDFAYRMAHETLIGPMVRHAGILKARGHDRPPKSGPDYEAAVALYRRYEAANGNREAMEELVRDARR